MPRIRFIGLNLTLAFAAACVGDHSERGQISEFAVRDSAGISIAENTSPEWSAQSAWQIESEPFLIIGTAGGERPGTDFGRIGGAARLSDGRIVVADNLSNDLRIFDTDGALLARAGGRGSGPSEFQLLDSRIAVLRGDSIVARDVGAFKSVVFGPDGTFGRTISGPPMMWNELSGVFVQGWLEDGSFIVSHTVQTSALSPGRSLVEQDGHYFDTEGNHVGQLYRLPSYFANNEGEGAGALALTPRSVLRTTANGFWHAFPTKYEFHHYTPGGLDRIVRKTWEPVPVPQAIRSSYRNWRIDQSGRRVDQGLPPEAQQRLRALAEARIDQLAFADTLPAFATFIAARDGHLWVQGYPSVEDLSGPEREWVGTPSSYDWTVFSPEGRWLGTVTIPWRIRILEIGSDYVMGVSTDELDVQRLVLHRILKPAAG